MANQPEKKPAKKPLSPISLNLGKKINNIIGEITFKRKLSFFPNLRRLAKAMMKRCDREVVKKQDELCPGGDIRLKRNQWLRAAYRDAGLAAVPRENRIREAVRKLVRKKQLCAFLSEQHHYQR